MAYGGDPANNTSDAVRSLLRDTSTSPMLTDNEVAWLIAQNANVYYAAAAGADMIAGGKSETANMKKVGDLSIMLGSMKGSIADMYRELGKSLRQQAVRRGVAPYAGGISMSDKDSQVSDTDWARSEIALGMHDNDGGSTSGTASF